MPTAILTRTTVPLAALALAAASSACGTDARPSRATQMAQTSPASDEQAIARRLDGLYTTSISGPALRRAARGLHIPAGAWALRIDVGARTLRLIAPEGGDITLRLASVAGAQLRIAPDTACESRAGRTTGSRLAWLRTDTSLRLRALHAPCHSDAAILTTTVWRAAWPTTPLSTDAQTASR